jgi:site-specific recombinase XerD
VSQRARQAKLPFHWFRYSLASYASGRSRHLTLRRRTGLFASTRLKGKQPRVANMLVEDHLRPAAVKAGVRKEGEKVRFGFRNLRHSLASCLVRKGTDVKTVQKMLSPQ